MFRKKRERQTTYWYIYERGGITAYSNVNDFKAHVNASFGGNGHAEELVKELKKIERGTKLTHGNTECWCSDASHFFLNEY